MRVIGCIFARGGSRGIPRKNLRLLGGVPLLGHAIRCAQSSRYLQRVIVSTEDEEIAEVARQFGAETPFRRPAELASDTAPEWLAWQHAIEQLGWDAASSGDLFVSVPPTAPLRQPQDIDACIERLLQQDVDGVITVTEAHRNPYFNMVVLDQHQRAQLVLPGQYTRRQDAPAVYDMTTVAYAARPSFVARSPSLLSGRLAAVIIPRERAVDIDTELDLCWAEFLLTRRFGEAAGANGGRQAA